MIRDDGGNGLWISNPNQPAQMYQITREEFDNNWVVEKSGDQQDTKDLSGTKWGSMGQPTERINLDGMAEINTPRIEVSEVADPRLNEAFEARSEDTDREAMKREILGQPVLDADFSGDPVAANTMSVSTFEDDRAESEADAEAMDAREEELAGTAQEFEAQTAQLDDDGGDDNADEAAAAPADEPMAGNEDPIDPERTEDAGKAKAAAKAKAAKKK